MKLWVATFFLRYNAKCDPCKAPEQEQIIGIWVESMFMYRQYVTVAVSAKDPAEAWKVINERFPDREVSSAPGFSVMPSLHHSVFPPDRPWVAERMKKAQEAIASAARQADTTLQD